MKRFIKVEPTSKGKPKSDFQVPTLTRLDQIDPEDIPQDKQLLGIMSLEEAQRKYQVQAVGVYGPGEGGDWFNPDHKWRVVVQYSKPGSEVVTKFHAQLRRDVNGRFYGAINLGWPLVYLTND